MGPATADLNGQIPSTVILILVFLVVESLTWKRYETVKSKKILIPVLHTGSRSVTPQVMSIGCE